MADNYLNKTGLQYYHNRIKTQFASADDLSTLSGRVDDIVSEGGEPNVINTVKVNGTALTPDSNKAVDVTVPTKTSDITNDGDGTSNFATEDYVDTNGGKIDKITVNGNEQGITNKTVALTIPTASTDLSDGSTIAHTNDIPTATSDLTNDSDFQTASDVQTAIETAISSTYTYKGSVATADDLPSSGNKTGDVYDVQDTGMNYAWNGSSWDALGQLIDASTFWGKTELTAITTADIDTIIDGEE